MSYRPTFNSRLLAVLLLATAFVPAHAQTISDLTLSALAGKTITCTIAGGASPFETSGTFDLQIDVPANGSYTIPVSSGNLTAKTGAYTYTQKSDQASFVLSNYFSDGSSTKVEFYRVGFITAGKNFFEMFAGNANKNGTYTIGAGSGGGTAPAPTITTQPVAQSVVLGGSVTFTVSINGTGVTYQWYFNGQPIAGANNASYLINAVTAAMAGNYHVAIANLGGSVTSSVAALTVGSASNPARISNMSVRTTAGSAAQTLIVGVVIGGSGTTGTKELLIRAVGPTLGNLSVANFLADPQLTAYSNGAVVASNDNWGGQADITAAGARVGAYPFANAQTKDAALLAQPAAGSYSVHVSGSTAATGIALAEIYDASTSFTATTPRLINVSARAQVGTGNDVVIAGFVIGGTGSRNVLIRALGPTLAGYGVTGALADPKLTLYGGETKISENDNWSDATNAAAIGTAAGVVGASNLVAGTKDAAILVTLQPGVYSAQVSGVANTTGVALVEVYEAP